MCDFSHLYINLKKQLYTKEVINLRIISGKYKGKLLKGFEINGTRPTMDRVKESLFAMIQLEIKGSNCLDLFAGSGSLGVEALSNGAESCLFVDQNEIAIQTIKENTKGMDQVSILKSDAFQIHNKTSKKFDLVFLDPPYHLHLIGSSLQYLSERDLLNSGAIIICESEKELYKNSKFESIKERKYGDKKIEILKYNGT